MQEYQLEIKQTMDYPHCRIYRGFVQNLIADRNLRTNGASGLFHYTVLCSYNAPVTIGHYYTALVNHDMAQGFPTAERTQS